MSERDRSRSLARRRTRLMRWFDWAAIGLLVIAPTMAAGQISIPGPELCRECETPLAPTDVELSVIRVGDITEDRLGRIWVVREDATIDVHNVGGDGLASVGRRGRGPREFMGPTALIPQQDSVWVADGGNARLTLVSPDLRVGRSVSFPGWVYDGLAVSDTVLLVAAHLPPSQGTASSLHLFDSRTGERMRSFGPEHAGGSSYASGAERAVLALSSGGSSVFAAFQASGLVQEWTLAGALVREWSIEAPWIHAERRGGMGTPSDPPSPRTTALLPIDEDTIGLGVWVPREDWERAWSDIPPGTMSISIDEAPSPDDLWRGAWVEVDLAAGQITSAVVLPFLPRVSVSSGVMEFLDTLDPKLRLWRR